MISIVRCILYFFIDCDLSLVNTRQILQIDDGTDEGLLHTVDDVISSTMLSCHMYRAHPLAEIING